MFALLRGIALTFAVIIAVLVVIDGSLLGNLLRRD
jgi:hypothetical protein